MPAPNEYQCFPSEVFLTITSDGNYTPSQSLVDLLINARNNYDWPRKTGAEKSQKIIINLIEEIQSYLSTDLTPNNAHAIIIAVSQWAGNNQPSHHAICQATTTQKNQMQAAISYLIADQECTGIDNLCALRGISLVIASKIFRFCAPQHGAAIDRHASYFFNSLPIIDQGNSTQFFREWANGKHSSSRLAIYNPSRYTRNRTEYFTNYLPLLGSIAQAMNAIPARYMCAYKNKPMNWTPADVEMAAYYWWAMNGAR